MPPPMRDDFQIRDDMSQNNLIQDKGMWIEHFPELWISLVVIGVAINGSQLLFKHWELHVRFSLEKINITTNHNYNFGSLAAEAFQIIALKLLLWIINNHVVSLVCSWSWGWRWKFKWITWKVWVSRMRTPLCSTIKPRKLQDSTQMFNDYSRPC